MIAQAAVAALKPVLQGGGGYGVSEGLYRPLGGLTATAGSETLCGCLCRLHAALRHLLGGKALAPQTVSAPVI